MYDNAQNRFSLLGIPVGIPLAVFAVLAALIIAVFMLGGGNGGTPPMTGSAPPGLSVAIAHGYTDVNITCWQPYMNDTPPNGQDWKTPIFNLTNNAPGQLNNITLELNASLTNGMSVYSQTANYYNPSSVNLSVTPVIVMKRLKAGESKGIWLFGRCWNATNNVTIQLNYSWGGG